MTNGAHEAVIAFGEVTSLSRQKMELVDSLNSISSNTCISCTPDSKKVVIVNSWYWNRKELWVQSLLYVIVQVFARFRKISGRVWSSHGLYFGETVGRAKIPMARPNKPWYFPESSVNLHDYMLIIPDQKMHFWKQLSLDLRYFIHAWTHAR